MALPPGRARLVDETGADRIDDDGNTIGTVRVACCNGPTVEPAMGQDDVRRERGQFRGVPANVSRHWLVAQRVSIRTLRPWSSPIAPAL